MVFVLPPREKVGYLDPEIAGEGQKVILSDGDQVSWLPPPAKLVIPDISGIKSIAKYFGRTGLQVWPAWLYHPTEAPRIVKNADEAAQLGVCYRDATIDERGRYGLKHVWDWTDESKWRPQPHGEQKFDPAKAGHGKNVVIGTPNPAIAQNALLEALIPTVTAAVVAGLKSSGNAVAPAAVDPAQWEAFLQFQAWQKTQQAVAAVGEQIDNANADGGAGEGAGASAGNALNALTPDQERALWVTEAEAKGIKVDGRWSIERLKAEVDKVAA